MFERIIDLLRAEIDESLAYAVIVGGSPILGWLVYKIAS